MSAFATCFTTNTLWGAHLFQVTRGIFTVALWSRASSGQPALMGVFLLYLHQLQGRLDFDWVINIALLPCSTHEAVVLRSFAKHWRVLPSVRIVQRPKRWHTFAPGIGYSGLEVWSSCSGCKWYNCLPIQSPILASTPSKRSITPNKKQENTFFIKIYEDIIDSWW